jgi:hypothetical protein
MRQVFQKPEMGNHAVNIIDEALFQANLESCYQVTKRFVVVDFLPEILLVCFTVLVDVFVPGRKRSGRIQMVAQRRVVDQFTKLGNVVLQPRLDLHGNRPLFTPWMDELGRKPQLKIGVSRFSVLRTKK